MVVTHLITHGLFFAVIFNGYLLLVMVLTSPRVWGYTDYPEVIKNKYRMVFLKLCQMANTLFRIRLTNPLAGQTKSIIL